MVKSPQMKWSKSINRPLAAVFLLISIATAHREEVRSPDGETKLTFAVGTKGELSYEVSYRGNPVLIESRLGFKLHNLPDMEEGFRLLDRSSRSHDETWMPVCGERREVRNHYHELTVGLEDGQAPPRRLNIQFRATNEGIAFRYDFPEQEALDSFLIESEKTEFVFTDNHVAWPVYSAQGVYERAHLGDVKANCERPLVVEMNEGPAVAVGEARLVDYARMRLRPVEGKQHALKSMLACPVQVSTPYKTPWRVVMVADNPCQLIEGNYLIENLNDPCAISDPSWIKPGKVIREVTLSTEGGKACVDFAAKMGLQYVEYDAGWYGPENDASSDATTVCRDVKKAGNDKELDLHEVIRYGKEKGIGIIVYVNRTALEKQLDEVLLLYRE